MVELMKKGTLGSILAASRIVSEADIQAALEEQARSGCRLGEALLKLGVVSQEDVHWALSTQLDIPYIRLKRELIDSAALALVPAEMARASACIPLFLAGDELNLAVADPLNRGVLESIELRTGKHVNISVALKSEIMAMIDDCYGPQQHESLGFRSPAFSDATLERLNADLSGARLLDSLLVTILTNRLTSLSLQPLGERVLIRGRRASTSYEVGTLPPRHYQALTRQLRSRASIPPGDQPVGGGRLTFEQGGRSLEFRVALLKGAAGDCVTLRLELPERECRQPADFGLDAEECAAFVRLARDGRGITFFASPDPLLRSRAMELLLDEAGAGRMSVLVLGDGQGGERFPRLPLPAGDAACSRLIMATLDHDPDLLVIGELAGGLSLDAACRAAARGVRLLVGLDACGSRAALRSLRFLQLRDPALPQLVDGLISLVSLRSLCPSCRSECLPTEDELALMGRDRPVPAPLYRSAGCQACGESGFAERRTLMDLLPFDDELRRLVGRDGHEADLERYLAAREGGVVRAGLRLVAAGELSPTEYVAGLLV